MKPDGSMPVGVSDVLPKNSILAIIEGPSGFLEPGSRHKNSDFISWMRGETGNGQLPQIWTE